MNTKTSKRIENAREESMKILSDGARRQGIHGSAMHEVLLWCVHGIEPNGHFARALIRNDLMGAFSSADRKNTANMNKIVSFLYNVCPAGALHKETRDTWTGMYADTRPENRTDSPAT